MPTSDYVLLDYVQRIALTVATKSSYSSSVTEKTFFGLLTDVSINNGALMHPVVYFKKVSVLSEPVRTLTHIPKIESGACKLFGLFISEDESAEAFDSLNGAEILQIALTYTEDDATEHTAYFRHCIFNQLNISAKQMLGVTMMMGSLGFSFGHTINDTNANYSSTEYDLIYSW